MVDQKKNFSRDEVVAVIRRVLAENGRDYVVQYAVATLCLLAVAATTAFSAWIMRDVVNEIFYRQRGDLIIYICLAVFGAFLVRGFAGYGQSIILARIGNNLVARYQKRIFHHLMKLGVDFFTENRSAQLAARINANISGVRDLLNTTLIAVVRDFITLIALVVVMVMQDPLLSAFAFLVGPPLILSSTYLTRRLRTVQRKVVEVNARLFGAMQEATQGIAIVKAFTMEEQLEERLAHLIDRSEQQSNKIASVSERLGPISDVLAGLAVAGVIGYSGWQAIALGKPPGNVFSFITALLLAYEPAQRLAKVQVKLERSLVNVRMIYEILDLEPQQGDVPDARPLVVEKGEVRFEAVDFGYAEAIAVLRDVSFVAEAGAMTAIVGASGAGKSTLTALLERFYDPKSGRIEIDGQDIARVTKQSLRENIAFVSQQPYLFEGTIADNLRYGREDATDADVERAAALANADQFIRAQPQGYATAVGENGMTLSGGQRQRLSIARALVRNAPILVLDEATSALDNESEARVQEALSTVMRGRTTIVIAHRLSTVVNADKIIVMDDGQIVEQGTHAQLLKNPYGIYSRYHRMQDAKGLGLVDDTQMAAAVEVKKASA